MAQLTILSGSGGKLPAAFLLDIAGKRILLDLGEGPEPGVFPDVAGVGPVDAIVLSHAHIDHVGGLALAATLGSPPVYATAQTWALVAPRVVPALRHVLPPFGTATIEGLEVTLGRSGHAPGGVWVHFAHEGGVLYTGDWSVESTLLPFDPPPPAGVLVTDASYGDRQASLAGQVAEIVNFARTGAVLAVPAGGRGPEMALAFAREGLQPVVCNEIRAEIAALADDTSGLAAPDASTGLRHLLTIPKPERLNPGHVIIAVEADLASGLSSTLAARRQEGFRFLLTGHVASRTQASQMLAAAQASWLPWNVHPRLSDTLALAEATGARHVVAAFTPLDAAPRLCAALGQTLFSGRSLCFGDDART